MTYRFIEGHKGQWPVRPLCEALEGRQLLSTAAGSIASGMPAWRSGGGTTAAAARNEGRSLDD